jgi:hypothetical protein
MRWEGSGAIKYWLLKWRSARGDGERLSERGNREVDEWEKDRNYCGGGGDRAWAWWLLYFCSHVSKRTCSSMGLLLPRHGASAGYSGTGWLIVQSKVADGRQCVVLELRVERQRTQFTVTIQPVTYRYTSYLDFDRKTPESKNPLGRPIRRWWA